MESLIDNDIISNNLIGAIETIKDLKINMEQKILEANNVIIIPHKGVDFDAIGSALGLSLLVRKFKKNSWIIIDDPIYNIDHGVQLIIDDTKKDFAIINSDKYFQLATPDDLFILTDVNKKYLITLSELLTNADKNIIIDHHEADINTVISNCQYIDCHISSASEIVTKILSLCKIKISTEIANYLLAGIYLDTNRLSKNVTSETMKTVAKLLEYGANMNQVTELFAEDFISDRRVQNLVSRAQMLNFSLAIASAKEDEEFTREELAKVADYLLKYKVDAAFAIGNIGDDTISVSARSKEKVNVGQVMKELDGGGNQYSGAAKIKGSNVEEVSKKLIKAIQPPCYFK